jgi:hypothetical protein
VRFAPLTADHLRVTVSGVRPERRPSGTFGTLITLPAAIVELGIPGVQQAARPVNLPTACISDLLSVDGRPFPIRLHGTTADALDGRPIQFTPCDSAATLHLTPGAHSLYGKMNDTTGLDFNRVVLSSAAGGNAVGPEVLMHAPAPPSRPAAVAKVVDHSTSSYTVELTGASKPTWLVVGQSLNPGWHATLDGRDLGPPQLVDGYANGWRIDPRGHTGPLRVSVQWAPQGQMRIAFALSILGMLACLAIVIGSWWRSRRRRASNAVDTDAFGIVDRTQLVNPFGTTGRRPSVGAITLTAIGSGVAAGVLTRPWTAIPVTILVAAALVSPRWRGILRILPGLIVLVILAWVSSGQLRHNYPASFEWPTFFERLRTSAWLVVVLLAVDGIVGLVRRDSSTPDIEAEPEPVPTRSGSSESE